MSAATNADASALTIIEFSILDVATAYGWEAKARAAGVRVDNVPTWRIGRMAFFVSLGTSTIFVSLATHRCTTCSVIAPRPDDLRLITALRGCGLIKSNEPATSEEVPA